MSRWRNKPADKVLRLSPEPLSEDLGQRGPLQYTPKSKHTHNQIHRWVNYTHTGKIFSFFLITHSGPVFEPPNEEFKHRHAHEHDGLRFWCAAGSVWSSAWVSAGSWTAACLYTCSLWQFSDGNKRQCHINGLVSPPLWFLKYFVRMSLGWLKQR